MSKIHELAFNAEEIDELLDSVDKKTIYQDATQSEHGLMSATDKTKLDALPTAQQIDGALDAKVDKEAGKGLSKNDYTDADKAKVASALQSETDPTVPSWAKQQNKPTYTASEIGAIPTSEKGVAAGVATLNSQGKIPVSQLPSYVDDVLEYANLAAFPATGESGKIYVAFDTNKTYRWGGSSYVEISPSLALGETSSTAFAGNRGKAIEDKIPSNASSSNKLATMDDLPEVTTDYDDFTNKPKINSVTLSGNKSVSDLGLATAAQGVLADSAYQKPQTGIPSTDLASEVQTSLGKADSAVQQVTVGTTNTGAAGTNASVTNSGTSTAPVLDFTIPRGADAVNPFKGWFNSLAELKAAHTSIEGDSAYVKDASPATTWSIYVYDATATTDNNWADSGLDADTSNVQTFASSQEVNEVHIVNDLTAGGVNDVLSAEQGKQLNVELYGVDEAIESETDYISFVEGTTYYMVVSLTKPDGMTEDTIVWDGSPASGSKRTNYIGLSTFATIKGTYNQLKLTNREGNVYYSYAMFVKKTIPSNSDLSYNTLQSGGYLCDGATFDNFIITIPGNSAVKIVDIPTDAVTIYFSKVDGSGHNRKLASIKALGSIHHNGDIDDLKESELDSAKKSDIVDNLDSDDADKMLSAAQGKIIGDATLRTIYPTNILDPSTIKVGRMVRNTDGAEQSNSGLESRIYGCTDYIEITELGLILNYATISYGTYGTAGVLYDESKQYIRNLPDGNLGNPYRINPASYPTAKYVRFNLPPQSYVAEGENYAVYRQLTLPPYSDWFPPYKDMRSAIIDDGSITVDKFANTELQFLSDNVCNPEECYFGNDKFIRRDNGNIYSFTDSRIGGYTGYIPIDKRGLTFTNINYSGNVIGGAVYNANKQYIRSAGSTGIVAYQDGDAYVRFTLGRGASSNNVMVNKGLVALPYVEYLGTKKVISEDILPDFDSGSSYEDGVEVVIPNEIVVTKGDSLQLFYRSMVKASNPFAYNIIAKATSGYPWPKYFELNTAYKDGSSLAYLPVGTRSLSVKVTDSASNEIATGSSTIRIIDNPSSPSSQKNILLVGASTFAGGQCIGEINRRLTNTDGVELTANNVDNRSYFANPKGLGLSNVSFVGRLTSNGVKHEAVSGRQMHSMVVAGTNSFYTFYFDPQQGYTFIQGDVYSDGTRQFTVIGSDSTAGDLQCNLTSGSGTPSSTGTLTLVSGSGTNSMNYTNLDIQNSNPFWNATTSSIDFSRYSTNYLDGADIDILIICLGINDMFGGARTPLQIAEDYKTFIRAYHTDFPNGKVILFTEVLPDVTGGMAASYKSSYIYWNMINKYFNLWKEQKELMLEDDFSDYVILCSSASEFDNENLYSHKTVKTSNRATTTYEQGTNALHYGTAGFNTVADSIYHYICYALNQFEG